MHQTKNQQSSEQVSGLFELRDIPRSGQGTRLVWTLRDTSLATGDETHGQWHEREGHVDIV